MALRYWRGSNTTWTDTNNWSATRTGSTGQTAPSGSDTVFIYEGDGDIAACTGVTAASITIGGNFQGSIPSMTIATTGCVVTIENVAFGKVVNIGPDAGVTNTATWHVKTTGPGKVSLVAGSAGILTEARFGAIGNRCVVDASVAVATLSSEGIVLSIGYHATAITSLTLSGGKDHDIQRAATTFTLEGGATAKGVNSVAYATMNNRYLSTYTHDSDGTITTLNASRGSTFQPLSTLFAVTTCNQHEGANINRNSDKIAFSTVNLYGNAA